MPQVMNFKSAQDCFARRVRHEMSLDEAAIVTGIPAEDLRSMSDAGLLPALREMYRGADVVKLYYGGPRFRYWMMRRKAAMYDEMLDASGEKR